MLPGEAVKTSTETRPSVIHLEEPGQPNPPLGDYLGQFTSELKANDHITEFVSGGPKNYGYQTKNGKVECKVRGFRLNSEGKTQLNYQVMRRTSSTKSNSLKNSRARPKSSKPTRSSETPKPTISSPSPTTSFTNWCTTRESSIPSVSKPIPTDTNPMPNQYLVQLATPPPDQLNQEERDLLHQWKKEIYDDVLRTIKNVPNLFKDHRQDLQKVLRALTRRDLPGIMQTVQKSPRFYDICENSGLFRAEPPLWEIVCDEIQAERL